MTPHDSNMMNAAETVDTLMSESEATHVAVSDGNWTDPKTWKNGSVPGADAKVFIPENTTVTYDSNNDVPLGTVRVDGTLDWASSKNTTMLVETIVSNEGSEINVGSMHDKGIAANVTAKIIFRDTPLDNQGGLDHGLVAFGNVDIKGAEKENKLVLDGGASAGSTSLSVEGDTSGWKVGDTILVVGTDMQGEDGQGSLRTQDEERVITAIDGNKITFDQPLEYNHEVPKGYDLETYVGNLSRNVVFSSENPDGTRGHVMLHNGDVEEGDFANSSMFAEFKDLGRTVFTEANDGDNPLGRYSLHLHQIGSEEDSAYSKLEGNSINGGEGWGIVQHDSNALVMDNIVYDVTDGGIVSEIGSENGKWTGNLVSSVRGHNNTTSEGAGGAAYENQSRAIVQADNIAANSKIGWNFSAKDPFDESTDGMARKMFELDQLRYDPSPFDEAISNKEPVLDGFDGNTVIASDLGIKIFHRNLSDDTDTMSVVSDFDVWGGGGAVSQGNYSSNYLYQDSTWIGDGFALSVERKTSAVVVNNVDIVGYDVAWYSSGANAESSMIDVRTKNVGQLYDQRSLVENIESASLRQELINYYRDEHGIDYVNPEPKMISSSELTPVDTVKFIADDDADLTVTPDDLTVSIHGTTIDSVGERRFNDYTQAKPLNGIGNSRDFEGIDATLDGGGSNRQEYTIEEFLEINGAIQKADGSWVSPVVHWISDRLTGDHHPVVIEIELDGFEESFLKTYEVTDWKAPGVNNPGYEYAFENLEGGRGTDGSADTPVDESDAGGSSGGGEEVTGGESASGGTSGGGEEATGGDSTTGGDSGGGEEVAGGESASGGDSGDGEEATGGESASGGDSGDGEEATGGDSTSGGGTGDGDEATGDGSASGGGTSGGEAESDDEASEVSDPEPTTPEPEITAKGTKSDDRLRGQADDDVIYAKAGEDVIHAKDGDDTLIGGHGADALFGGDGADVFYYEEGSIGGGYDNVVGFSLDEGDAFDISELVSGADADTLSDYVKVGSVYKHAYLAVDADGGGDDFVPVAKISHEAGLTLDQMIEHDALLF